LFGGNIKLPDMVFDTNL